MSTILRGIFISALAPVALFSVPARADITKTAGCNMQFINQQTSPGYESTFRDELQSLLNNAGVKWTSCYRSVEQQRAACHSICGKDSCPSPSNCAPPGQSNHQKVATADVGGLPGDATAGCNFLYQVCQKMRSGNSQLGCEIGSYGAGANHLAVGPGIRNAAYNQCSFLRSKLGLPPSDGTDDLKNDGDSLTKQITGAAPAAAQAAQAGAQAMQAMNQSQDQGSQGTASTTSGISDPSGASDPTADGSPAPSSSTGASAAASMAPKISSAAPQKNSSTGSSAGGMNSVGTTGLGSYAGSAGTNSTGASAAAPYLRGAGSSGGAAAGGGGASGGNDSRGNTRSAGSGSAGPDATDEYLMSFSGGYKFGGGLGSGGGSGKSNPLGDMPENAVVNSVLDQAEKVTDRAPASEQSSSDGVGDGNESLFSRDHDAISRCLMRGCVSMKE